jgi:hypothetical protein
VEDVRLTSAQASAASSQAVLAVSLRVEHDWYVTPTNKCLGFGGKLPGGAAGAGGAPDLASILEGTSHFSYYSIEPSANI